MQIYTVSESLSMESNKLQLGYLAGKLELKGLDTHESSQFEYLLKECVIFYGLEERELLKEAITEYTLTAYKKLLKGVEINELQA